MAVVAIAAVCGSACGSTGDQLATPQAEAIEPVSTARIDAVQEEGSNEVEPDCGLGSLDGGVIERTSAAALSAPMHQMSDVSTYESLASVKTRLIAGSVLSVEPVVAENIQLFEDRPVERQLTIAWSGYSFRVASAHGTVVAHLPFTMGGPSVAEVYEPPLDERTASSLVGGCVFYVKETGGIGGRRVVGLSADTESPMLSVDPRYTPVFDGSVSAADI